MVHVEIYHQSLYYNLLSMLAWWFMLLIGLYFCFQVGQSSTSLGLQHRYTVYLLANQRLAPMHIPISPFVDCEKLSIVVHSPIDG